MDVPWQTRTLPSGPTARAGAADLLSRAFGDDPVARHVDPDPIRRAPAVRAIFDALLAQAGHGVIVDVVGDPIAGVAIWLPPDPSLADEVGLWSSLALPMPGQLERFEEAIGALDEAHSRVFAEPHWYLIFVGTDPDQVRRGIGGALVRAHDAEADAAGVECGLEAFGDDRKRFYEHLGWEVALTTIVPYADEPLHSMRRRPRRA